MSTENTSGTSEPTQPPAPTERESASLDQLSERLRETEGVDEDIALLIASNWQKYVGGLIVVLIAVWLWGEMKTAEVRKLGEASQRYEEAQNAFSTVISKGQAKTDPAKEKSQEVEDLESLQITAFQENVRVLGEDYQDTIYGTLAPLYSAQASVQNRDFAKARSILEANDLSILSEIYQKDSARLVSKAMLKEELAALIYVRLLLSEGETDRKEILGKLTRLCRRSSFVSIEALIMLFRISTNEEERASAVSTAKAIMKSRPDLADAVKREIGNLGASLE